MSELYERVEQLADYYMVSKPSEFAKITGFSHQVATNYLKSKRNPTTEALTAIIKAFPGINSDWLLTGKGEMLKNDSGLVNIPDTPQSEIDHYKSMLEMMTELLKEKERYINMIQPLADLGLKEMSERNKTK